jgi:predicted nucleic acid-binding Zn finger protein
LPATVDIGDWVNIEEADQSATACYQIVGLEYDQSKGRFWIELGSTEDYYLESIAGNRGTFDLSLSNY